MKCALNLLMVSELVEPEPTPHPCAPPSLPGEEEPSLGSMSVIEGTVVNIWGCDDTVSVRECDAQVDLRLQPDQPVVIGRQEGGELHYLDPKYTSTPVLPETDRCILSSSGKGRDRFVSRGHFMLRGNSLGIVLVNGVPQRGGGVRPPKNFTRLLLPENRLMIDAEEYLIEKGNAVQIQLPNETVILIRAV